MCAMIQNFVTVIQTVWSYVGDLKSFGDAGGPTPLGWGYGWPLKTCYSPCVLPYQILSLFRRRYGSQNNLEMLWLHSLGIWAYLTPLEICFSTNCVTMPNSVILGQTVRAWLCRSARKLWPLRPALSTSLNVIGTDTDWSATYDFLLVFQVTMRYRIRFSRQMAIFS